MHLYALLLRGIMDIGDILSFVRSLYQMLPNLTTCACRFFIFLPFLHGVSRWPPILLLIHNGLVST